METLTSKPTVGELYCPSCEKHFTSGERCPTDNTKLVRLGGVDPFIGIELDGRYTVNQRIGSGAMGAVYRAHQHSVGRDVAVKVVNTHLVAEPDVIKRFLREAKLASRLGHPNAVGVLDFGQTDAGVCYLVMELVSGKTLDKVLEAESVLPPQRVAKIGIQICEALEAAHALSIVHRDLKPSNVMLLEGGRDLVKVLDFGLAKSVAPDATMTTMTNAGAIVGTPAFMPPELALGISCDGRADLYSLGCVLYFIGSGRLPFMTDSVNELMELHAHAVAPPMPGVPSVMREVVAKLLEKRPEDRYQTAAEARAALEELNTLAAFKSVVGRSMHADAARIAAQETMHSADSVVPVAPRKRSKWPLAVLGAAVLGGGIAFVATRGGGDKPPPPAPQPAPAPVVAPPLVPVDAAALPDAPVVEEVVPPPTKTVPKKVVVKKKPELTPPPPPTTQQVTPPPPPPTSPKLPF